MIHTILIFCFLISGNKIGYAESGTATMKSQIETVSTDGFSVNYTRFGHGENVLVILPGLSIENVMKFADTVAEAYELFNNAFSVYLFDRRKELPETYSIYDMAQDTVSAIRALNLEQINLFGVSQGGMIALMIAINSPELIKKLVVGSSAASMGQERYRVIEHWLQLATEGKKEELYLAFGEAIYPRNIFEQSRELLIESSKSITEEDLARFMILAEGTKNFDVENQLQKISCPVLVIGSKDDQILGESSSEEIAEDLKGCPDCELYLYDGYGHAVYDLAPDYKDRIRQFLLK